MCVCLSDTTSKQSQPDSDHRVRSARAVAAAADRHHDDRRRRHAPPPASTPRRQVGGGRRRLADHVVVHRLHQPVAERLVVQPHQRPVRRRRRRRRHADDVRRRRRGRRRPDADDVRRRRRRRSRRAVAAATACPAGASACPAASLDVTGTGSRGGFVARRRRRKSGGAGRSGGRGGCGSAAVVDPVDVGGRPAPGAAAAAGRQEVVEGARCRQLLRAPLVGARRRDVRARRQRHVDVGRPAARPRSRATAAGRSDRALRPHPAAAAPRAARLGTGVARRAGAGEAHLGTGQGEAGGRRGARTKHRRRRNPNVDAVGRRERHGIDDDARLNISALFYRVCICRLFLAIDRVLSNLSPVQLDRLEAPPKPRLRFVQRD